MLTVSKLRDLICGLLHKRLESLTPADVLPAPKLARLKKRKAYKGDPMRFRAWTGWRTGVN